MKLIVPSLALAALFTCTIQASFQCPTKKIPVTARKQDPLDTVPVTVKITKLDGTLIKASTFTKNTSGVRVKKLYFCFAGFDQMNKIEAIYKGETFPADNAVSAIDGKYGAELVIDTARKKIEIKYKKPKVSSINATLVVPKSGSWTIISGNQDYTQAAAQKPRVNADNVMTEEGILEKEEKVTGTGKRYIKIYKNQDIRIYAENDQGIRKFNELISKDAVTKAGKKPVLVIAPDGTATLYAKMPAAPVSSSAAATTGASAAAGTAASAQSQVQSSANKGTPPTLSEHIALKHLLLNKGGKLPWKQFYTQNQDGYKFNEVAAKTLMDQELNTTLVETPYVAQKLSNVMLATPTFYDAKKQAVRKLQGEYAAVYKVLLDSKETIGDQETKQIKALRTAIINALK